MIRTGRYPALRFGTATSDRVEIGTSITFGTIPFTILAWVYVTTLTNTTAFLAGRRNTASATASVMRFQLSGTSGNVELRLLTSGTQRRYITNDTPIVANKWIFIAGTFDEAISSGKGAIYGGTLAAPPTLRTLGTNQDGTGTISAEDSGAVAWANALSNAGAFNAAIVGSVAIGHIYNRVFSLEDIRRWWADQRVLPGCINAMQFGADGLPLVVDLSGSGMHGTITGAVISGETLLLPRVETANLGRWKRALFPPATGGKPWHYYAQLRA